jgi:hypothetical protein
MLWIDQYRQSAAPFTPPDLGANLLAWWENTNPSYIIGLGTDGSIITAWNDQSGNNRDLARRGLTFEPTLQTNELNGNPVIRFDGVNDGLVLDPGDGGGFMYANGTIEIWAVFKSAESGTGTIIAEGIGTSANAVYRLYDDDTANDCVWQLTNTANVDRFLNTQDRAAAGTWNRPRLRCGDRHEQRSRRRRRRHLGGVHA